MRGRSSTIAGRRIPRSDRASPAGNPEGPSAVRRSAVSALWLSRRPGHHGSAFGRRSGAKLSQQAYRHMAAVIHASNLLANCMPKRTNEPAELPRSRGGKDTVCGGYVVAVLRARPAWVIALLVLLEAITSAAWAASYLSPRPPVFALDVMPPGMYVRYRQGLLWLVQFHPDRDSRASVSRSVDAVVFHRRESAIASCVAVPFWLPFGVIGGAVAALSALLRRRVREAERRRLGRCLTCGYDLRASPEL